MEVSGKGMVMKMKKGLLIRLDDITPDMDWNRFYQLQAIFERLDLKPLLGIVPDNQDPKLHIEEARTDFAEKMKALENKGWVLAQHGYCHVYEVENSGILGLHHSSEFAGLPYERQLEKIRKGKELLEQMGIFVNIFMAPGHTFDENTLQALQDCGFVYVTDGYGYTPYREHGLTFIPCTLTHWKEREGIDTICIHANTISEAAIRQLEKELTQHREQFITWQEVLCEAPAKTRRIARIERQELAKRKHQAFLATDPIIQDYFQKSNASNRYIKIAKRILGLPGLGVRLLCRKGNTR